MDILCWLSTNISRGDSEFVCVLLWSLWYDRNCFFHNAELKEVDLILSSSVCFLKEFQDTVLAVSHNHLGGLQPPSPAEILSWIPPPADSLKLNSDVSILKDLPFVGVGAAICDSIGTVIAAVSKRLPGFFSADSGELLALCEGLLLAQNLGLTVSFVECDAINSVSAVLDKDPSRGAAGLVVSDIRALGLLIVKLFLAKGMAWPIL
ncbi:hypothetical protein ACOSP7_025105 [Xanthoceras sorbifolium]